MHYNSLAHFPNNNSSPKGSCLGEEPWGCSMVVAEHGDKTLLPSLSRSDASKAMDDHYSHAGDVERISYRPIIWLMISMTRENPTY
jgi:hypothetical protein